MYKQDLALDNLQGLICHKTLLTSYEQIMWNGYIREKADLTSVGNIAM